MDKKLREPLPFEVKQILKKIRRIEYAMMKEAGWCTACYRKRPVKGKTKCPICANKAVVRTTNYRKRWWPTRENPPV